MFDLHTFRRSLLVTGLTLAAFAAPLAVLAQDIPSYARSIEVSTDETIHGRIASVDGAFTLSVDDDRGFVDNVQLHQGTIINPTGLSLSSGMSVTILGYNGGNVFHANEIDTPYSYSGPIPTPVFYGPGYWCPGFAYGYGPSFSLAIVIGGGYRFEHHPFYGRPWDGNGYFGGYIGHRYEGHEFIGERRGFGGEHRGYTGAVRGSGEHVPAAFAGRTFAGRSFGGESRTTTFGHAGTVSPAVAAPYTVHAGGATNRSMPGEPRRAYGGYAPAPAPMRAFGPPPGGMMRAPVGPAGPAQAAPRAAAAPHGGGIRR